MDFPIIDNAQLLPRGQITIPTAIRKRLSISAGDRLTLICESDRLVLMNSAIFALKEYQRTMKGEAEQVGLHSDDDIVELIMQMRREEEA